MATKSFSKDARIPAQVILDAFDALENEERHEERDVPVRELESAQVGEFFNAILIRGMKLPTNCHGCDLCRIEDDGCGERLYLCLPESRSKSTRVAIDEDLLGRPDWCPLVEVG